MVRIAPVAQERHQLSQVAADDLRRQAGLGIRDLDDSRVVVFVANPVADPIDAEVGIGQEIGAVTELWTGDAVTPRGSILAVAMPAYSIKIFQCAL